MPDNKAYQRKEFVVVVDNKNESKTVRLDNVSDLEGFLYKFGSEALAQCVWDSLLYNYKAGVRAGMKKVGLQPAEPKDTAKE